MLLGLALATRFGQELVRLTLSAWRNHQLVTDKVTCAAWAEEAPLLSTWLMFHTVVRFERGCGV